MSEKIKPCHCGSLEIPRTCWRTALVKLTCRNCGRSVSASSADEAIRLWEEPTQPQEDDR